jgi:hypothetical protein
MRSPAKETRDPNLAGGSVSTSPQPLHDRRAVVPLRPTHPSRVTPAGRQEKGCCRPARGFPG